MSMNHYISSDNNVPEAAQRWSQHMMDSSSASIIPSSYHHHHHISSYNDPNINLNQRVTTEEDEAEDPLTLTMEQQTNSEGEIPKEPLFQKPLTPSDVGKLNRLVIPKQHAEKYFPLNGDSGDQKGLLLSFEDEAGKCWRFRYSYWNSSQSYVLTKGWSRFVKEKKLDAGDVVLFLRHRADGGRMFIGWRRKGVAQPSVGGGWRSDVCYPHHQRGSNTVYSNNDYTPQHAGSIAPNSSRPVNNGKNNNSKRLRLFGVNLECQTEDSDHSEPSTPVGSPMSTSHGQAQAHHQPYHHYYNYYINDNNFTRNNINFLGADDVYR